MLKRTLPFFLILLLCSLLAACGGGSDTVTTTATTTAPTTTSVSTTVTTTAVTTTVTTTAVTTTVTTPKPVTTTTAPVTTTAAPVEAVSPEALLDAANAALLAEDAPYCATINGRFLTNNFFYAPLLSGITLNGVQYADGTNISLRLSLMELVGEIGTIGNISYASYPKDEVTERYRATVNEAQKEALIAKVILPKVELSVFSSVTAVKTDEGWRITCQGADAAVIDTVNRALDDAEPHMPEGITLSVSDLRLSVLILPDGRYGSITAMADCTASIHGFPLPTVLKITYLLDYDGDCAPTLPEDIDSYTELDFNELLGGLTPHEP